jgi:hypothetical protein
MMTHESKGAVAFSCHSANFKTRSESTLHPNSAWVTKQADLFVYQTPDREEKPAIVMHDKDSKFTKSFAETLKRRDVRTNSLPKRSPRSNGNAFSDFSSSASGTSIISVAEFVDYYNTTRSSMVRDHLPPIREQPDAVVILKLDQVEMRSHGSGLVKSFVRNAG